MSIEIKMKILEDLFKTNNNKITYDQLKKALGNERRARHVLSVARAVHKMVITPTRHGMSHDVLFYTLEVNSETEIPETPARRLAKIAQNQIAKSQPTVVRSEEEEYIAHARSRGVM